MKLHKLSKRLLFLLTKYEYITHYENNKFNKNESSFCILRNIFLFSPYNMIIMIFDY